MQQIEITGTTGIGPYDVYICDITLTYCFLISGSTTIPPSVYFELPQTFTNPLPPPTTITFGDVSSLVIKIVDLGSGCEKFIPYYCSPPTPTPTITPSPTTTPSNCLCNRLDNPTSEPLTFTYYDCENTLIYDSVPGYTSVFVCGTSVSPGEGLILSVLGLCIDSSCPNEYLTPTPTPTITLTPTPSPTEPPCVCYQISRPTTVSCDINNPTLEYENCDGDIISINPFNGSTYYYICSRDINSIQVFPIEVCSVTITALPNDCESCFTPSPTPTVTQTPTPTNVGGGNKIFQIGSTFIFMNGDIYIFEGQ